MMRSGNWDLLFEGRGGVGGFRRAWVNFFGVSVEKKLKATLEGSVNRF